MRVVSVFSIPLEFLNIRSAVEEKIHTRDWYVWVVKLEPTFCEVLFLSARNSRSPCNCAHTRDNSDKALFTKSQEAEVSVQSSDDSRVDFLDRIY